MLSEKRLLRIRKSAAQHCIALSVAFFFPSILYSAEERSYAREIRKYVDEDTVYLLENTQQNITRPSEKTVVEALLCESGPQAIELFQKQLSDYPDPALDQISNSRIAAYNLAFNSTAPLPKLSRPLLSAKPQESDVQGNSKQQIASISSKTKEEITPRPSPAPVKPAQESAPLPSPAPVKPPQELALRPSTAQVKPIQQISPRPSPTTVKPTQESTFAGSSGFTLQFGYFGNKANAENLTKKISLYEPVEIVEQGQFYSVRLKKLYATKQDAGALTQKLPFTAIIVPVKKAQH
ncbi:MAG: SPOR domain-containing protein [Pelodictyon phaeoclathratiforme]